MKSLTSKITKSISFILDEFLPPVIRDCKLFYGIIIKIWNPKLDPDFKVKAFKMSEEEFVQAYEEISPMRETDNTKNTVDFVLNNIKGKSVLEVGCGNGDISIITAQMGYDVTATDLAKNNLEIVKDKCKEQHIKLKTEICNVENIPFDDKSFDTTICLHTLEHVRNLNKAISELKRVTKQRIIIIVPKQKFHRYTADYHLNFFSHPSQLIKEFGILDAKCDVIDFCLCYLGNKE